MGKIFLQIHSTASKEAESPSKRWVVGEWVLKVILVFSFGPNLWFRLWTWTKLNNKDQSYKQRPGEPSMLFPILNQPIRVTLMLHNYHNSNKSQV